MSPPSSELDVQFCVKAANVQRQGSRFFYVEHPLGSPLWNLEDMKELREKGDVEEVIVHMNKYRGVYQGRRKSVGTIAKVASLLIPKLSSRLKSTSLR